MGYSISKLVKRKNSTPEKYPIDIQKRIVLLEREQTENVCFNIGGKIFKIGVSTIEESKYSHNMFKVLYKQNPNPPLNEIFIDRSFEQFDIFLQILRYSGLVNCLKRNEAYPFAKSIHKQILDKDIFREDLKFYFQEDTEQVVADFDLSSSLDFNDHNHLIESYELINLNPDEKLDYMFYRAKDIKEILNIYCRKGFFCSPGGGIIVKLSKATLITRVEMKPFLLDKIYWNEEMCPTIKVYGSINNDEWNFLGTINLLSRDNENISSLCMINTTLKFIKICAEKDFHFSISYLKLF